MNAAACDEFDPTALTVEQARAAILEACRAVTGTRTRSLETATGRVLAADVHARLDVPPARVSAMDGYALRAADARVAGSRLRRVGQAAAGHPWDGTLPPGSCVRILTGAVVPDDADTVVMQEHVTPDGDSVQFDRPAPENANIRGPGEDTRRGEALYRTGQVLGAAEIGVLASQGIAEVDVLRKPRVVFFSTGDELVPVDEPLEPGQIHDSNRHMLRSLLSRYAVKARDYGIIPDDEDAVREALESAGREADLILTTGGVSVGDADYITRILQERGEVGFWKIAMKPGRPLAFGRFGQARFVGLPGNPVSAMATFGLFVGPALRSLAGLPVGEPRTLRARLCEDLRKRPGRTDYQRAIVETEDGVDVVRSAGGQGSHQLSAISRANAFVVLPREADGARAGEWVEVLPFSELY